MIDTPEDIEYLKTLYKYRDFIIDRYKISGMSIDYTTKSHNKALDDLIAAVDAVARKYKNRALK